MNDLGRLRSPCSASGRRAPFGPRLRVVVYVRASQARHAARRGTLQLWHTPPKEPGNGNTIIIFIYQTKAPKIRAIRTHDSPNTPRPVCGIHRPTLLRVPVRPDDEGHLDLVVLLVATERDDRPLDDRALLPDLLGAHGELELERAHEREQQRLRPGAASAALALGGGGTYSTMEKR